MAIIAGIDEVGYGPKLGPLVVCATAFRSANPAVDLWKDLAPAVGRTARSRGLPVADSKRLFSQGRGIGTLEPTACAFLSLLPLLPGRSFRGLVARLTVGGDDTLAALPWYRANDFAIPQETAAATIGGHAARLWKSSVAAGAMAMGCWSAWSEPDEFNRRVDIVANKSDLLFDQAATLVKSVLAAAPGEDAVIRIGKQGGRTFYLPGLVREFGSVWVVQESKETSIYEFRDGGRRVRIEFLMDGEDRDFCIALSSIVGKYLREGAMRLFNEYWIRQLSGLRRTAGYGADARRFYGEIRPHLERLRIEPDAVLRKR